MISNYDYFRILLTVGSSGIGCIVLVFVVVVLIVDIDSSISELFVDLMEDMLVVVDVDSRCLVGRYGQLGVDVMSLTLVKKSSLC